MERWGKIVDSVNKTLYIPLYGKAYVSRKGLFLDDPKAEEIWSAEGFALKGKSKSRWLAYFMGIRSAVFDTWLKDQLALDAEAVVVHIGCGMDSRVLRVAAGEHQWYDVDFPTVIRERKRYYAQTQKYRMIAGDARESEWLASITENGSAVVVMEGLSMYLTPEELEKLMAALGDHFDRVAVLMDCYSTRAAKLSKYKNPINEVGVTKVYGMDAPQRLQQNGWTYVQEHNMVPQKYVDCLQGLEKQIFRKLYAGGFARKLYRMFEYRKE